jgi:hypothetical protein
MMYRRKKENTNEMLENKEKYYRKERIRENKAKKM